VEEDEGVRDGGRDFKNMKCCSIMSHEGRRKRRRRGSKQKQ
jgi:hypothetical protein